MTSQFDSKDIQDNKVMALLSYLGILVLVPIFAAKDSKFARFHANQGLVLIICEIAWSIVYSIVTMVLAGILGVGVVFSIITGVLYLVYLVFFVLAIIGIINAVRGKAKELPIIGKYTILK